MVVVNLDSGNFDNEVTKSEIPVIIDFWASWCGPCRMMAPVFEELSGEYEGKLKFGKLSTEEHPEIAQNYEITSIPCLIIVKDGEEIDRIVGFAPKEVLKQRIDGILG